MATRHWRFANDRQLLRTFSGELRNFLEQEGCDADLVHDLELVTEELLVNIVLHGYDPGEHDQILVDLVVVSGTVELLVSDRGRAFNPLEADERPEDKVGGWGIPLIQSLTDEISYTRIEGMNQVRLVRGQRET